MNGKTDTTSTPRGDDRDRIVFPGGPKMEIVSRKAVVIGLVISGACVVAALLWTLAGKADTAKKLVEFHFAVEEPDKEEFTLKEPMRDIMQEQPDKMEEVVGIETVCDCDNAGTKGDIVFF